MNGFSWTSGRQHNVFRRHKQEQFVSQHCICVNRWTSFPWNLRGVAPFVVAWVNPRDIAMKLPDGVAQQLLKHRDWPCVADFDPVPFEETAKFISVRARITDDIPWEETPMFEKYRARLEAGGSVKGHRELRSLAKAYETRFAEIVRAMSSEGFSRKLLRVLRPRELPWVLRLRSGAVWFGNQGNHRLSIAKIIGLDAFPVLYRFHHCSGGKSGQGKC